MLTYDQPSVRISVRISVKYINYLYKADVIIIVYIIYVKGKYNMDSTDI